MSKMATKAKACVILFCLLLTSTLIDLQKVRSYSDTATLTDKSSSFLAFENFNSSKFTGLSFRFKTYCVHCLLMYVDNTKMNSNNVNYIRLTLRKGQLIIDIQSLEFYKDSSFEALKKTLKISRDLNDVQWHQIDIKISDTRSTIRVDNESKTLVNKMITLSSLLYFGGVEHSANISIAADSKKMRSIQRFVGCIGSVNFHRGSGRKRLALEVKRQKATVGCLNLCKRESCENKGKCLNLFTKTSCDCIGTGYEGLKCTREVSEAIFLNKTDHIGVKLRTSQKILKVKLRFRTRDEQGLLLATSKRSSGFYVAIVDGRIRVSIDHERGFYFGSGTLHDSQWHFLVVSVSFSTIYIELDGKYNESRNIGNNVNLITSRIFIGGLPENLQALTPSAMPNNFVGCLQQIYVYDINIVYKLIHSDDSRLSFTKTLKKQCIMKHENVKDALKRISDERKRKTTIPPLTKASKGESKQSVTSSKTKSTNAARQDGKTAGYSKLAIENNKDLIAWISSGVVSGTIVLMIITACAIHYFKYKYESIFVSRLNDHEFNQEQQRTNNAHALPKQQAVVFLQDKQMSKVVNL